MAFVRMIGRGYASRVWQCTDTVTGDTVAVKVYHKSDLCPLNHHQIHREAVIHSSIRHPNILPFLGTFSDPENIYMVLQFCLKGDLYSYLKQKGRALSENQVWNPQNVSPQCHLRFCWSRWCYEVAYMLHEMLVELEACTNAHALGLRLCCAGMD